MIRSNSRMIARRGGNSPESVSGTTTSAEDPAGVCSGPPEGAAGAAEGPASGIADLATAADAGAAGVLGAVPGDAAAWVVAPAPLTNRAALAGTKGPTEVIAGGDAAAEGVVPPASRAVPAGVKGPDEVSADGDEVAAGRKGPAEANARGTPHRVGCCRDVATGAAISETGRDAG